MLSLFASPVPAVDSSSDSHETQLRLLASLVRKQSSRIPSAVPRDISILPQIPSSNRYGKRYELVDLADLRVREAFSATLRNEVDLATLSEHLVAVVQETMQPTHVSLWLRKDEQRSKSNTNA